MTTQDKLAVAETVYRYATGIDTRDFALYRSIFAPEVAIDFTSYSGGEAATMTADQWVKRLQPLFLGLDATQHSMTNPIAEIDGDSARCRMYMQAHHVYEPNDPTSWFTIGGYYDDTLVRSEAGPAGWLMTGVTLTVLWRQGDPNIMVAAASAGAALGEANERMTGSDANFRELPAGLPPAEVAVATAALTFLNEGLPFRLRH